MKTQHIAIIATIALGGVLYISLNDSPLEKASTEKKSVQIAEENLPTKQSQSTKNVTVPSVQSSPTADAPAVIRGEEKEKLIDDLPKWVVTYDKAALNKVKAFAFSADTEIRAAAIDAIVAIGISEGADVLEEALKSMTVPEEIVETKAKIKFLRLPSALEQ